MIEVDFTEDLLHLPATYETRVFANQNNGVSIWQDDPGNETLVIALTKDQAEQVYLALKAFVEA